MAERMVVAGAVVVAVVVVDDHLQPRNSITNKVMMNWNLQAAAARSSAAGNLGRYHRTRPKRGRKQPELSCTVRQARTYPACPPCLPHAAHLARISTRRTHALVHQPT